MKILIPVLGFGKSGGDRVLAKLATELVKKNHDVVFVAPKRKSIPYYPTKAKIVTTDQVGNYNKYIDLIFSLYFLWKRCRELNPDIVIANFNITAYIVAFLPRKIKKFYYIQAYEVVLFKNKVLKFVAYISYFLPLKKIVNHEFLLPKKINNYVSIVSAGIDNSVFYPNASHRYKKNNTIGIIGRKEKHKGTSDVISALIKWKGRGNIHLNVAIYLDDVDKRKLEDNGIKFSFFPIINDEDLGEFYRKNDLMLAVGLVEDGAFHYPCAESMACGCIVISNYSPLVNTESKFKIDTFNEKAIIEKLNFFNQLSIFEIEDEIKLNSLEINKITWEKVGDNFNRALLKE
ncbi:glycosyltransferase family 4 protein [Pectobacterium polaris]|uniref:Glycosyltransferase n=1 Tax=Pectobacterium polaris TaxID=2042057 RepID=A0AAW5G8Z7_9GAMM|nr:glycosyltransferase family 4 protein [Pectobacterium polaris]MCL6349809.1 glycosyltransferase [Pectobacterium polaris]MCL6367207.1 glycosyltransferase [Pectobacterium polaris]